VEKDGEGSGLLQPKFIAGDGVGSEGGGDRSEAAADKRMRTRRRRRVTYFKRNIDGRDIEHSSRQARNRKCKNKKKESGWA